MSAEKGSNRYYYVIGGRRVWLIRGPIVSDSTDSWALFWDERPQGQVWYRNIFVRRDYARKIAANPIADILFGFDREQYELDG